MGKMPAGKFLRLNISGEEIDAHYHERGKGDNTVIFVQTGGAATSGYMCWYLNLDAFADAGYHVFAPDSVGFGFTQRVSEAGEKGGSSTPKFILAFMDKLAIPKAHLVGNSAGSMAITRIAVDVPGRVKSLTLTGGEPRLETEESRVIAAKLGQTERMNFVRQMLSKDKVEIGDMRKATADFFYDPDHPAIDEITEMRLEVINRPGMLTKERAHASKQVERGRANYQALDLMRIDAPCNLIHGRDERFFFAKEEAPVLLECAIKPFTVIPNCNCTVLAHCGHWPQIEKAETFNALSLEFLKDADKY